MNGIEKISARILADAEAEAAAIRAQAGEKAAQLRADYDRRIELEQQRLTAEAQAEGAKQLERDQGAARMAARRQLLNCFGVNSLCLSTLNGTLKPEGR